MEGPPDGSGRALLEAGVLCNDAAPGAGGTEGALVSAALSAGIDVDGLRRDAPRSHVVPFDSVRREMLTRHQISGGQLEVEAWDRNDQNKTKHPGDRSGAENFAKNLEPQDREGPVGARRSRLVLESAGHPRCP